MPDAWLSATLPVLDLAMMSVEAVRRAAVRAGATGRVVDAPLDLERVAATFGSERLFRDGAARASAFAPLSGFYRAADGYLRTHANYPHHRDRLLGLLGLVDADREAAAKAIAGRSAAELEEEAARVGAIAVRVRGEAEWRSSAPGQAAATGPLVRVTERDDVWGEGPRESGGTRRGGGVRREVTDGRCAASVGGAFGGGASSSPQAVAGASPDARGSGAAGADGGTRPLAGVRVLDLTRVLAGPVAGRTLALLGADVLRLDPKQPAEIGWQHLDTGQGKRTALLDLRTDLPRAQTLLAQADVLLTGYRPGAIEAFEARGLRIPAGIVRARINAWGDAGPWAGRRGFDSIVQAASGIALIESADDETPGALPAQALDHATGYLLAAGIIDALTARAADGHGRDVLAPLARTATWLLDAPGRDPHHLPAAQPSANAAVTHGDRTTARPAIPGFDDYPHPAHPWGSDEPSFS
ncbi:CoA-transferase family III [Frankia sp. AiPs1]